MQKGEAFYKANKHNEALAAYQEALQLKPAEQLPREKIAAINKMLAAIKSKEQAEQETAMEFMQAMAEAERHIKGQQYDQALTSLNKAKILKPADTAPGQRINEVNNLIAQQKQQEQDKQRSLAFNKAMSDGDNFLANKQYDMARAAYSKAGSIIPSETLPNQKLAEVDNAIEKRNK
ncbi:MAG: hypothetical protein HC896_13800 [Bacteroidales bacterium]|nr:hypothetical protein [Bacteroidales bacterium]